jgi:predicted PurR-regulated permease PerM
MAENTSVRDDVPGPGSPNLEELKAAFQGPLGIRSLALTGLFIFACFYTLYFARQFFLPITLALVLSFLLRPPVRLLARVRIPEALGAAVVILALLTGAVFFAYQLSGPLADWIEKAPQMTRKLERQVREWRKPVEQVTRATEEVQALASPQDRQPRQVELRTPGLADRMLNQTWSVGFGAAVLLVLLYFLLASGDLFLRKLIKVLPTLEDKKRAVQIAREIEDNISRYLITVTIINAGLGIAASLVFWALGMPNPMLWGAMAGLLNFIPYLGAMITISITGLVALATYPSAGHALLVPAAYFALTSLEGNFITPWVLGRRLTLNPVVIFVGLTFWGWLWGIPGALLAVPMLAMFKIFCDHLPPLSAIGEFLGN